MMSQRGTVSWAWEVAQIAQSIDGLTFRTRFIGDTQLTDRTYAVRRSHPGFREVFDPLRHALTRRLVVEVAAEDEPDEFGHMTVTSVSLHGQG
jgi:hypothetical protein